MTNQRKVRLVKKGSTAEPAEPAAAAAEAPQVRVDMRVEVLKKLEKRESASVEARATWRRLFS